MKAIYLRTSTEEQNPQNQLNDCLSLAGLTLQNSDKSKVKIFEEKQSAFKDKKRPIFESMRKEIKFGKIDDLYVWDWDRPFRNRKKLKEFFEFCKLYNCSIHSYRQKFFEEFYKIPEPFDDIMQDLFLNLLGWMAEDESQKKSDRVKIAFKNYKGTKKWGRKGLSKETKKEIIEAHQKGMSIREVADSIFIWDKNNNRKAISKSTVHKTIQDFKEGIVSI